MDKTITFSLPDPTWQKDENSMIIQQAPSVEILKITPDGFYYKGEKVEDVHNVYERFNEWLIQAHTK